MSNIKIQLEVDFPIVAFDLPDTSFNILIHEAHSDIKSIGGLIFTGPKQGSDMVWLGNSAIINVDYPPVRIIRAAKELKRVDLFPQKSLITEYYSAQVFLTTNRL